MVTCDVRDFVTGEQCTRPCGHMPFHTLPNGTAFGIGYTPEDEADWRRDSDPNDPRNFAEPEFKS